MGKKLTLEEVLERFKEVHGDKYSYELIKEYHNQSEKLPIICREHGVFLQSTDKHFRQKQGCPKCDKSHKKDTAEFVLCARKVHGDKYSYPEEYKASDKRIRIICPIHGEFSQTPHMHLCGQGCPKCYGNEIKTTKQYIEESRKVHGGKYNYSKTEYKGAYGKVVITCPKHGDFKQIARVHLYGHGCPQCSGKKRYDKEYFIQKAKEVHGDLYDYSLITIIRSNLTKVPILCKRHGIFFQTIDRHINARQGCPKCIRSVLEEKVARILNLNSIEYEEQKKFDWLGNQRLDFYLPKYNIAIECQGVQHFKPCGNFGSKKENEKDLYAKTVRLDIKKNALCKVNGVQILYYAETNTDYRFPYCQSEEELLNEIKKRV